MWQADKAPAGMRSAYKRARRIPTALINSTHNRGRSQCTRAETVAAEEPRRGMWRTINTSLSTTFS